MDEVKNVLYLSYDGMTDSLGQSQVLPYLEGLAAKKNVLFHIISFEKEERFHENKAVIEAICTRSNIIWHPLSYTKKPPLLSTLYDIQRMKKLAYQLNKTEKFSIVHCRSYLSAIVGLGMKKRFGTKFLFDMRGFWADERVEGKIWNLSNPVFKRTYTFFKKQEGKFLSQADAIVSLTNKGKEVIETWDSWKSNRVKIDVIPCCADMDLFNPSHIVIAEQESLRTQHEIKDENFVLGYVGSIGTWYMLPEMLDFFKVFHSKNDKAIFLFVTNENPQMIQELAVSKGINTEAIRITSSPRNKMPLYISLFDFSIFFIIPSFSKQASSPVKQGEIMGMGIPVLCNSGVGDTDSVVTKYNSGLVINELKDENYRNVELDKSNFNPELTRSGAKDYFDIVKGIKIYSDIYERLWRK
jgi:glycosyltransferase involved in cell wall biosynthesis|tara:strand:- start:2236 stop:3471 length:1236 start_codon:yes stop_codon:yes gene_type:complete